MKNWRLLDTGARSATENMCLDQTLLEARAAGKAPNTLRFLQFRPHAALLGFHQSADQELRQDYCRERRIEINRRITGGGAVYFGEKELGWEIIADRKFFKTRADMRESFELLCAPMVETLRAFDLAAAYRPLNDIEVQGRKISGTGGTHQDSAFLFQGTLLIDFDLHTMLRALRIPTEKLKDKEVNSLKDRVTSLIRELGYHPGLATIKNALAENLATTFKVTLVPSGLSDWERRVFLEKLDHYKSDSWIHKTRQPLRDEQVLFATYKAPGGIIHVSLLVNEPRQRVKMVLITGDFFAYPQRAIYDLEAMLKNCHLDRLEEVIRGFFEDRRPVIPGVSVDDWVQVFREALRKRELSHLGLTQQEANQLHAINGALKNLSDASVLLLPYCAKLASCKLRHEKDCLSCGQCTVGVAYELARQYNLEPITIVNFEDLLTTLGEMKDKGVKGYLGCCCEPFFVKHRKDFERAEIPGLLINIDNTTCYDLDRVDEALQGEFKEETELKLELLHKVIAGSRSTCDRS